MRRHHIKFLVLPFFLFFIGCESTDLLKESIALQKQMLANTTGMRDDMKAFADQMKGLVPELKASLKDMSGDLMNGIFEKGLVLYMQAKQDLRTGAKDLFAAAGPEIFKGLAEMSPEDQAKIGAAFTKFLKTSPVGGITQELATLNGNLGGLKSTLGGLQQMAGPLLSQLSPGSASGGKSPIASGGGKFVPAGAGAHAFTSPIANEQLARIPATLPTVGR